MSAVEASQLLALDKALLEPIEAAFVRAREAHPGVLPCARGCSACCVTGFSITLVDVWRMAVGLESLAREGQEGLIQHLYQQARATELSFQRALKEASHALTPPSALDNQPSFQPPYDARELPLDRLPTLPCPALSSEGACLIYACRPRICRLQGLRYVDPSGAATLEDFCAEVYGDEAYRNLPPQHLDLFHQWETELALRQKVTEAFQAAGSTLDSGFTTHVTGALLLLLGPERSHALANLPTDEHLITLKPGTEMEV